MKIIKFLLSIILLSFISCERTDYDLFGLHNHSPEITVYNYVEDAILWTYGYNQTLSDTDTLNITTFLKHENELLYGNHTSFYVEPEKEKFNQTGRFKIYLTNYNTIAITDTVYLHVIQGQKNKHYEIIFDKPSIIKYCQTNN